MWNAMRFAVKHNVAATVVIGGLAVFVAASYFALLAWAVLTGQPLAGPLAFPFMVVFTLLASIVAVLVVLLPVTTLTEWICARTLRWPLLAQIPAATVMLVAYVVGAAVLIAVMKHAPAREALWTGLVFSAILLIPLGAYWWSLQSTDWLLSVGVKWWGNL